MPPVGRSFRLFGGVSLALLALLALLVLSPSSVSRPASAYGTKITVNPPAPVEGDFIRVTVQGSLPTPCYEVTAAHTISGKTISMTITATPVGEICIMMIGDYSVTEDIGVLAAGEYAVNVTEVIDGGCWIECTASTAFTVEPAPDSDGDGWLDAAEIFMGTDPAQACGQGAWPPDAAPAEGDGLVHIEDVTYAAARFGARTGEERYTPRIEIASQDGVVHIDDITAFAARFGRRCSP